MGMWPKPSTGGASGPSEAEKALGINPPVGGEHDEKAEKGAEHMRAFHEAHAKGDHHGMHNAMAAHHAMMNDQDGDEAAPE